MQDKCCGIVAPMAIGGPVMSSEGSRKRKKREQVLAPESLIRDKQNGSRNKWRSVPEQQFYSSKLIQVLGRLRSTTSSQSPRHGREIHEAADRALAISAKGMTRWSRAILMSTKVKVSLRKVKRQRVAAEVTKSRTSSSKKLSKKMRVSPIVGLGPRNIPIVKRKTRVLGGLVPGCSKQPLPVLLEEATDYIAALQMQVRAMAALAQLLIGFTTSN